MIYNDDFVWLHFPKCAGSRIETIFQKYFSDVTSLVQDPFRRQDDPAVSWHDSISQREKRDTGFRLGDRKVICSFRRLTSWIESRYNFECMRSPHLGHNPKLLLLGKFLEQNGRVNHADNYVRKYLPRPLLSRENLEFVRVEHFEVDFHLVFGKYLDTSRVPSSELQRKSNASKSCISAEIKSLLLGGASDLYKECPYWSMVEGMAYGST